MRRILDELVGFFAVILQVAAASAFLAPLPELGIAIIAVAS